MERPAVDHAAAAAFLNTRFADGVSDVVLAPRQGAWSRAYFFRHDGRDLVIRFAENASNFEQDRRFAVHSSPDLPIPQVLEIGEADGAAYAITERVYGDILEELDADRMRRTLPSLFGALDAMRAIDLSATTGFGPPLPDGNGEYATWREFLLCGGRRPTHPGGQPGPRLARPTRLPTPRGAHVRPQPRRARLAGRRVPGDPPSSSTPTSSTGTSSSRVTA